MSSTGSRMSFPSRLRYSLGLSFPAQLTHIESKHQNRKLSHHHYRMHTNFETALPEVQESVLSIHNQSTR